MEVGWGDGGEEDLPRVRDDMSHGVHRASLSDLVVLVDGGAVQQCVFELFMPRGVFLPHELRQKGVSFLLSDDRFTTEFDDTLASLRKFDRLWFFFKAVS